MQRQTEIFDIAPGQYETLKHKMLNWANRFSILLFLDSCGYADKHSRYACLLATGNMTDSYSLDELYTAHTQAPDWYFGHICYEYKDSLEAKLHSRHVVKKGWGNNELHFFRPQVVCHIDTACTRLTIESIGKTPSTVLYEINSSDIIPPAPLPKLSFERSITREKYLETIGRLRQHIADGDCYEINFCNEGHCEEVEVRPLDVYRQLSEISPAPFSAYYRSGDSYIMCASPERYLYKRGNTILSQPIKGTARRDADEQKDAHIKQGLYNSLKDRAENVMIVDLVRNDLARSCRVGSVQVDELFGIYSFPQVHQMISTVKGELADDAHFTDAIRYSFPMGSMTGAPKIKVMQLIDEYEQVRRELFSGTVGYIAPSGDFDLNVVIRSMFYNAQTKYLSYQSGGAITYDSDPQQEWEEMRLKSRAIERIFS